MDMGNWWRRIEEKHRIFSCFLAKFRHYNKNNSKNKQIEQNTVVKNNYLRKYPA